MILQDPAHPNVVLDALADLVADPTVRRLRVAVAYANRDGVLALERLVAGRDIEVLPIVTLDMGITRKAALERLLEAFGDSARTVTTTSGGETFHAKAYVVDRDGGPQRAIVGSANLTGPALRTNHEAITLSDLSHEDTAKWEAWWERLDAASDALSEEVIAQYRERKPPPGRREVIADDEVETDDEGNTRTRTTPPIEGGDAGWLVIDWGGTGGYRKQFEFPKLPSAFFRPEGERDLRLRHDDAEYGDNQLTFYENNGMWRINMDPALPFVADGSIEEHASLFTRIGPDHYEIRLLDEQERAAHLAEAALRGEADHTQRNDGTLRQFGWAG
jgi:hypothetical protein